jgi:hypothetical protein
MLLLFLVLTQLFIVQNNSNKANDKIARYF